MAEQNPVNIDSRSSELKRRILNYTLNDPSVMSIDGLLDALVSIYDECCSPNIREEKVIGEFLEYGEKKVLLFNVKINLK
jgi:hypothetical protein